MIKQPILKDFPEQFETERLLICAPHPDQIEAIHEAVVESWERLHEWMPWAAASEPQTLEDTAINTRQACVKFLERSDLRLHLFLKESNTFIGGSGLHRINWSVPAFRTACHCRKRASPCLKDLFITRRNGHFHFCR